MSHASAAAEPSDPAHSLRVLLDTPGESWRQALDKRYAVLDEVLSGARPVVVYPAAGMGRKAAAALTARGAKVAAFGDRDSSLQGTLIDDIPVLSPAEVAATHSADPILVASAMFDSVICEDLLARGCKDIVPVGYLNLRLPGVFQAREFEGAHEAAASPANRAAIEKAFGLLADDESRRVFVNKLAFYLDFDKARLDAIKSTEPIYFDPSVYALSVDEAVVDGGAYVGDTLQSFLACASGQFHSYFAFEPDGSSYGRLARIAASDPERITAVEAGLGRHTCNVRLLCTAGADSRVLGEDEPGGQKISIVGLDEFFEGRQGPTLIKMDIEGSEADALMGANELIGSAATKLAVSAYHFPADLWEIPLLISELMPHGRLYLRHYSREIDDTVCYAIPIGLSEALRSNLHGHPRRS